MLSRVSGSQCLWRHSSVQNTCVKEAACVDLYDGNELSQIVPSVTLLYYEEQTRFLIWTTPTLHAVQNNASTRSLPI